MDEKYYISMWESDYSSTGVPTLVHDKVLMIDFNSLTDDVYEKHVQHMIATALSHLTYRKRGTDKEVSFKIIKQ